MFTSQVGFEPIIPVFERAKTVHALDRAAGHCDQHKLTLPQRNIQDLGTIS
jgi:hypothetical protein